MKRGWLLLAAAAGWIAVCGTVFAVTQHTDLITGWYWSTATATTVGYGDRVVRGTAGEVFAIVVMLTTVPALAAAFALITSGRIRAHVDRRLAEHHEAIHDRLDRLEAEKTAGRDKRV